jgi:AcrR family transcriptional regulator
MLANNTNVRKECTMARPKRSEQIDLESAIKTTALEQIAENGAAALSLRAIARALKITAPAIYNYFPSRDELVTALIVDAFTSFADSLSESIQSLPVDDHAGRLRTLGWMYRQWAVIHPQRYQLIFGTPIPGYVAPLEITLPAAARSLNVLVDMLSEAHASDTLKLQPAAPMSPELETMLEDWSASRAPDVDLEVLFLALTIWGRVHGLVALEIGQQFPPFITDAGVVYHRELESIIHNYTK